MFRLMLTAMTLALLTLPNGCDNGAPKDGQEPGGPNLKITKDMVNAGAKDAATPAAKDADNNANKGASKDGDQPVVAKNAAWIEPEDRQQMFMDFNMTDQDGKPFNLKQALGKPTVATFIFTRCPNPRMCPLQAKKMAWIQQKLEAADMIDKVNVLLISFDPDYDTPERLNKFGKENGVNFETARMLRPRVAEFGEFIDEFPIRVGFSQKGEINHKTDLFMLDHKGGFARMYYGMWEDEKVLGEVKRLIEEAKADAAAPAPAKDEESQ